jgi:hypothetical protein
MICKQLACICAALIFLFCGCDPDRVSQPDMCQVTGEITLDGQAISGVKVVFVPQRTKEVGQTVSRIASGLSNDRGEFTLEVDSRDSKQIHHDRYRVIVSKIVDGKEIFHKSYNRESALMVEVNSHESIQRPKLVLVKTGTY